jgi:hypothetical protein
MITYKVISQVSEKWGIDATVRFSDENIDKTITFRFDSQKQMDSNFKSIMTKAIENIITEVENNG